MLIKNLEILILEISVKFLWKPKDFEISYAIFPSCRPLKFANICLNRTALKIVFHGYQHHYGTSDVPSDENRYMNKQ